MSVFLRPGLRRAVPIVLGVLLLAGCGSRPRAPALTDEPIYQSKQEGLRFLPPDGWHMHARAEMPPGKLAQERLLVDYRRTSPDRQASLLLTMDDVPADKDLAECVRERGPGRDEWTADGPVENLEVAGQPAARGVFRAQLEKGPTVKEIVAVRRGTRVYFFTSVFGAKDTRSRDLARRAVASLTWD